MPKEDIERQAKVLARENRKAEPEILKIFWFPDENEIRLVEVVTSIPANGDQQVLPFYFRPSPQDNLPAPSGVALIRPEEVRQIQLPANWGDWDAAVELNDLARVRAIVIAGFAMKS